MCNFFTSDHHFGHDNILRHCAPTRPFRTVDAMHEAYIARWNARVRPEDTVWYLGDWSMKFAFVEPMLARLHGIKHLVVGNHDTCFQMVDQQVQQYLDAGFTSVQRMRVLELAGQRFVLCHFPYRVPEDRRSSDERTTARQERYAPFSPVPGDHEEIALLHGHVHQHWRARVGVNARCEINVGCDVWEGAPASEDDILALLADVQPRLVKGEPQLLTHWGAWIAPPQDASGD